ncbi:MAG: molybdenum cofactor guanylyltransferase [Candidatus Eremiobacteraeota bacterium]|nr:molybdenum cofactor guanylyltransferase [Candidatus Eremiobacteraeota bacterium]
MPAATSDVTVVLLAGGEATRLPRKLERTDHGDPLIVRAYERLAPHFPVVISASATFSPEIDARLTCPIVIDRWSRRGPLAGIVSAFAAFRTPLAFVVAADMPQADADIANRLLEHYSRGDDAVVPKHLDGVEPLCALYDRISLLRNAPLVLSMSGAVRDLLAGMEVRFVPMETARFANINTRDDWGGVRDRAEGSGTSRQGAPD